MRRGNAIPRVWNSASTFVIASVLVFAHSITHAAAPPAGNVEQPLVKDDATQIQGCYRLTLSAWSPAIDKQLLKIISPPSAIELTGSAARKGFVARPALGASRSALRAYWYISP